MKTALLLAISILTLHAQNSDSGWLGFAPYPGARQLCDQAMIGQTGVNTMEIHWRSYATADALAKVVAFYVKTKVAKEPDSTFRLDKDTGLTVHGATDSGFPTCDSKPKSGEKTVIVVSHAAKR